MRRRDDDEKDGKEQKDEIREPLAEVQALSGSLLTDTKNGSKSNLYVSGCASPTARPIKTHPFERGLSEEGNPHKGRRRDAIRGTYVPVGSTTSSILLGMLCEYHTLRTST